MRLPTRRLRPHRAGFTLLEMVVTLIILGVLAALGYASYQAVTASTQRASVEASLREIDTIARGLAAAAGADDPAAFLADAAGRLDLPAAEIATGAGATTDEAFGTVLFTRYGICGQLTVDRTGAPGTVEFYDCSGTPTPPPPPPVDNSCIPPTAPQGPTTPGQPDLVAGDSQVTVGWDPPSGAGGGIDGYEVWVSYPDGSRIVVPVAASATSAVIDGLVNGDTYRFEVYAATASNGGCLSAALGDAASTATPTDLTAPAVTPTLVATAGAQSGQVHLTWQHDPVADFGTYVVRRGTTATPDGTWTDPLVGGLVEAAHTDEGLVDGTTYHYQVRIVDRAGNVSAWSNVASATPADLTPPAQPTSLTATGQEQQVAVAWTAPGDPDVAHYDVERRLAGTTSWTSVATPTTATFSDTTVTAYTTYEYRVFAVDDVGNRSAPSNVDSAEATDTTAPACVTTVDAQAGDLDADGRRNDLTVTWTAPADTDRDAFTVHVNGSPAGPEVAEGGTHRVVLRDLPEGTHTVTVTSRDVYDNDSGDCGISDTVTVDSTPPRPPASISLSVFAGMSDAEAPDVSGDGRFVTFTSGEQLLAADTNTYEDVYLYDRQRGDLTLVSHAAGAAGDHHSSNARISADGTTVVFNSNASNLIAGDTNGNTRDIFAYHVGTAEVTLVSVAPDDTRGNSHSYEPAVSGDGRYVAFTSFATSWDTNHSAQGSVYVKDRTGGALERVSPAVDGGNTDEFADKPDISDDGNRVVFRSFATNLHVDDADTNRDVFIYDRTTDTLDIVSRHTDGTVGNADSDRPVITADGTKVIFQSFAWNLVTGDTNGRGDLFVRDIAAGTTELVTLLSDGTQANNHSYFGRISSDGRYVAFTSQATNLTADSTDSSFRTAYLLDRNTNTYTLVAKHSDGTPADAYTDISVVSNDGLTVVFDSRAANLTGRSASLELAYVHDVAAATTAAVSTDGRGDDVAVTFGPSPSTDVVGYDIVRCSGTCPPSTVLAGGLAEGAEHIDGDVSEGNWTYGVVAVDASGNRSDPTTTTATIDVPPAVATGLTATAVDTNADGAEDAVTLTWDAHADPTVVAFSVYRCVENTDGPGCRADLLVATVAPSGGASETFTDSGLAGGVYRYLIRAEDSTANMSGPSRPADASVPPAAPATVTATANQQTHQGEHPSVSGDGRYVAFHSRAQLVAGDTNSNEDVYVYDRQSGAVQWVSSDYNGSAGNHNSYRPRFSTDGRYIVFQSYASDLVAGDTNGRADIFRYTVADGTVEMVSVDAAGTLADNSSMGAEVSSDGRYVSFTSYATNWANSNGGGGNYYRKDMDTGELLNGSPTIDGQPITDFADSGDVSDDGNRVVFRSLATNLTSGNTDSYRDVFVTDFAAGTTELVSVDSTGGLPAASSDQPRISDDGSQVLFSSYAYDLVSGDTNSAQDLFVRDLTTATTTRVSVAADGTQSNGNFYRPDWSGDGRFVVADSHATNLTADSTGGHRVVYLLDRNTGAWELITVATDGTPANDNSYWTYVSEDGNVVGVESRASNFSFNDFDADDAAFARDRAAGTTTLVSTTGKSDDVEVVWDASTSASAAWYDVYRCEEGADGLGCTPNVLVASVAATGASTQRYVDADRLNGDYRYGVATSDGTGLASPLTVGAVTVAVPPAPPQFLSSSVAGSDVTLTWQSSTSALSYDVYRCDASAGPCTPSTFVASVAHTGSGETFTDTGRPGGEWAYHVTAVGPDATSGPSNVTTAVVQEGTTFAYTGTVQSFVVPADVYEITVEAWGAQGGAINGGQGGYATGTLAVTPGETLNIYVGGQGARATSTATGAGWNGGGDGQYISGIPDGYGGGGGGGASDVRQGGTALSDRVVVAGGGGGSNGGYQGGQYGAAGGGSVGATPSPSPYHCMTPPSGGTQSAGGAAGSGNSSVSGTAGSFGSGGNASAATNWYSNAGAGGGGGGYYGGGGGTYPNAPCNGGYYFDGTAGAGGSSYVGGVTNGTTSAGVRAGHGVVTLTYQTSQSATFAYTGAVQTLVVPADVTSITVRAWGAEGGGAQSDSNNKSYREPGGKGGYATGTLTVTPGETLYIYAGGMGEDGLLTSSTPPAGGWNGGGNGATSTSSGGNYYAGGGGGGATDIRQGGTALSDRVIAAGGGGGAGHSRADGYPRPGGVGGGASGTNAANGNDGSGTLIYGGAGGSQTAGGISGYRNGGSPNSSFAGTFGNGGPAWTGGGWNLAGGGGGGGYYGGGGGYTGTWSTAGSASGGGGGSSYLGGVGGASTSSGARSGNGEVLLIW